MPDLLPKQDGLGPSAFSQPHAARGASDLRGVGSSDSDSANDHRGSWRARSRDKDRMSTQDRPVSTPTYAVHGPGPGACSAAVASASAHALYGLPVTSLGSGGPDDINSFLDPKHAITDETKVYSRKALLQQRWPALPHDAFQKVDFTAT